MKAREIRYFAKSFIPRGCDRSEIDPRDPDSSLGTAHSPAQEPHKCVNSSLASRLDLSIPNISGIFVSFEKV